MKPRPKIRIKIYPKYKGEICNVNKYFKYIVHFDHRRGLFSIIQKEVILRIFMPFMMQFSPSFP